MIWQLVCLSVHLWVFLFLVWRRGLGISQADQIQKECAQIMLCDKNGFSRNRRCPHFESHSLNPRSNFKKEEKKKKEKKRKKEEERRSLIWPRGLLLLFFPFPPSFLTVTPPVRGLAFQRAYSSYNHITEKSWPPTARLPIFTFTVTSTHLTLLQILTAAQSCLRYTSVLADNGFN